MIDIAKETLILFSDLPKHLPKRGKKDIHLSACYRWKNQGIAGVRLETVFIAGNRWSSIEALNRFWQRVTEAKDGRQSEATKTSKRTSATANNELDAAGW